MTPSGLIVFIIPLFLLILNIQNFTNDFLLTINIHFTPFRRNTLWKQCLFTCKLYHILMYSHLVVCYIRSSIYYQVDNLPVAIHLLNRNKNYV